MKILLYFRILFTSTRNSRGISGVARPRVALDKLDMYFVTCKCIR